MYREDPAGFAAFIRYCLASFKRKMWSTGCGLNRCSVGEGIKENHFHSSSSSSSSSKSSNSSSTGFAFWAFFFLGGGASSSSSSSSSSSRVT